MTDDTTEDPEWEVARAIWAAGEHNIPARRDDERIRLLTDLKFAAGMFMEAKRVTVADQDRKWSPDRVVRLCRQLSEILYQIDEVTLDRMAGNSDMPIDSLIAETLGDLARLERAMENAPMPRKARKRKHDIDDFLIIRLADTFHSVTRRIPSVTTDWKTSERRGVFVDFVQQFVTRMLPKHSAQIDGRVIQRALELRKKWADIPRPDNQGSD